VPDRLRLLRFGVRVVRLGSGSGLPQRLPRAPCAQGARVAPARLCDFDARPRLSQLWGDARRASFPARRRRLGDVAPVAR
jgi:hypothetical protein